MTRKASNTTEKKEATPKKKSLGKLSEVEKALIEKQRLERENIEEGSKEIAEILKKRNLQLVVNPRSPIGSPSVMLSKA